jgi:pyruvate,orthophosphate dikinase
MALRRRDGHDSPMAVAVIVQAMVFGNRLCDSYTGIAYSRDPNTGAAELTGEFYAGVQGIDVVSGRMTPVPLVQLEAQSPSVFGEIAGVARHLERQCADAQEFEFTVEQGKVYILQSRPAGRSVQGAIRVAVELAEAGVIPRPEAVRRISPDSLTSLLHARFDRRHRRNPLTTGQPASPGAAVGKICFSADDAIARMARGERVILVRRETDASDVIAMQSCEGILTSTGGMTSHAAVVARGMGKPCIVGAGEIEVDESRQELHASGRAFSSEDTLSIDGVTGEVFSGEMPRIAGQLTPELERLLTWADEIRTLRVYANADTPQDGKMAVRLGAEGVGLCRTEHMFFDSRRIVLMRKLILAGRDDVGTRTEVLAALLPHQRADFVAIFKELAGRPVVVRLLDPPLHEFLPHAAADKKELAKSLGLTQREIGRRIDQLHEANPMLGHRGCRLAVTFPEIIQMQVRAILEAAMICREQGIEAAPRIMVPLVIGSEEMALMAEMVRMAAEQVMRDKGILIHYEIGTMIETPRAALLAGQIAEHAHFFSFGTNDLTQATLSMSRDDSSRFLPDYEAKQLLTADPFRRIDEQGVGELMKLAIERGRAARPELACSVCGEHAGEAASIRFFSTLGVDYISCSPLRLPVARLAAAHAAM